MSVEKEVDLEVDLEDNSLDATVTTRREIHVDELFNDDGELRLWKDSAGWDGYVLEDDKYFWVNTRFDEDSWIRKTRVSEGAVEDAVREHIQDPDAGGEGNFRRRCSPP